MIHVNVKHAESVIDLGVVVPRVELCIVSLERGDYEKAHEIVKTFDSWELTTRLDDDHPIVARMQYAQAMMLIAQGGLAEALTILQRVVSSQKARMLPNSDELMQTEIKVVELLLLMANYEDAGNMVRETVMSLQVAW